MKKISIILSAAAVLLLGATACDKMAESGFTQNENGVDLTDRTLCFSAAAGAATRAFTEATDEVTTENLKTTGFYAVTMTNTTTTYAGPALVSWNSTDEVYKYATAYYYPKAGSLDVCASWPVVPTVTAGVVTASYNQATYKYEEDLVVAKSATITMPYSTAVPLTFNHALAQVSAKFKSDDSAVDIYVTNCKIGTHSKGTYKFSDGTWTLASADLVDVNLYDNASGAAVSTTGTALGDNLTIIPRTALPVTVSWECRAKGTNIVVSDYTKSGTIDITAGTNSVLVLTLTNDAEELRMTAIVNSWGTATERDVTLTSE